MRVTVAGLARLRVTTARAAARVDTTTMRDAAREAAQQVRRAARVPVRSGRLRSSLTATVSGRTGIVGTRVVYAPPINFGWPRRNIRASRFLHDGRTVPQQPRTVAVYRDHITDLLGTIEGT